MHIDLKQARTASNDKEIIRHLRLFEIDDQARRDLRTVQQILLPHMDLILADFYDNMQDNPEIKAIFQKPEMMQKAREGQANHWLHWVFAGRLDGHYLDRCRQIGRVHLNVGVTPDLYLYAYQFLQRRIRRMILKAITPSEERLRIVESVEKALFLDMELSLSVYCDEMSRNWRESSQYDYLTGIKNRRGLQETIDLMLNNARRHKRPLSVGMLDLDHFKQINDSKGHDFGDQVLLAVSTQLQNSIRDVDVVGRWGGEEFIILMPETDLAEAIRVCERIRRDISEMSLSHPSLELNLTASIGLSDSIAGEQSLAPAIQRADQALYRAKSAGRNCVHNLPAGKEENG